jgi:hypothetical protein
VATEEPILDEPSESLAQAPLPTEVLHPFDPSRITKQTIWIDFIQSDCNILRKIAHGQRAYLASPLVVLALEIALIVLDVRRAGRVREANAAVHEAMLERFRYAWRLGSLLGIEPPPDDLVLDLVPKAIATAELVARIVFQVFALPFFALSNISVLFLQWTPLRRGHGRIFVVKIVGFVFFLLCGVALIAGFAVRRSLVFFQLPPDFAYERPSFGPVTESPAAPICDLRIGNMSILKIAGLPVLTHALGGHDSDDRDGLQFVHGESEASEALRVLYRYIFPEEAPPTPAPSPMADIARGPMCASERASCVFLYGMEDCAGVANFSEARAMWCRRYTGICDLVTVVAGVAVRKGIPERGMCAPTMNGFAEFACGDSGACNHWNETCARMPTLCQDFIYDAMCRPYGLCNSFHFDEKCSPMNRVMHMYTYNFQLALQFIAVGLNRHIFMTLPGFTRPQDVAIAVENVGIVWFHWIVATVVPFYNAVYGAFLEPIMGGLGQTVVQLVFGPNRMPLRFGQEVQGLHLVGRATALVYQRFLGFGARSVLIGHSHSALVVKPVAMMTTSYGVAFEGSQYQLSPLEGFFGQPPTEREYVIVNEASGDSIFAMDDTIAKWNFRMPDWQKWWKPANAFDSFCLLAAGCVFDDRYDALCKPSVGAEEYRTFFESWSRERN